MLLEEAIGPLERVLRSSFPIIVTRAIREGVWSGISMKLVHYTTSFQLLLELRSCLGIREACNVVLVSKVALNWYLQRDGV